jgi:anaerobic magnesium-protoporphyrin IX monomethyl ester cyclase
MARNRVVLVYPYQGFSGTYVKHMPLGLLYAAAELVKHGFEVKILDTRVLVGDWRPHLRALINDDTLCVGVSVMSGGPIKHGIEIGRFVKSVDRDIPVVWGGPHATFYPETIIRDEWSCDYVVSGYASKAFHGLCAALQAGGLPTDIPDVTWREPQTIRSNYTGQASFEYLDWHDIPYQLIDDYSPYGQLDQDKRIFSMYSAHGCPYLCSFCSSPAQYSTIKGKRWVPIASANVVDHVQHVVERYGANYIYFIDDDSFPKLEHVGAIIEEIKTRGLPVGLGFRGARINEIKRMSHAFLDKLAAAGTDILHIGAESGSDRVLKVLRKDCTAQDIIDCNRKLAAHPTITAAYNFMMGVPTETLDDLKSTRDLMLRLVDDHPNCIIFPPNKFRPLPGTELYKIAYEKWGYEMPNTLEAWSNIEVEGDISAQWYEKGMARFCNLMLISSYFIDDKVRKVTRGKTPFLRLLRLINTLYRPIARFRLRHGMTFGLVEYQLYRLLTRVFVRLQRQVNNYVPQS